MKHFLALIFIFVSVLSGFGQHTISKNIVEVNFNAGYLVKNYPAFPERIQNPYLITGRYGIRLNGSRFWHRYYRYPIFSVQAGYINLGNKSVLGDNYFLIPELAITQKAGKKFHVEESMGLGLAFFTKPFDPVSNPTNTLTGSRITFMPTASFGIGYELSDNLSLFTRVSIHHGSNSHYKLPNLGANIPSAGFGIRYILKKEETIINEEPFERDKRYHLNIRAALGLNQRGGTTDYVGDKHFPVYLLQTYVSHNYHEITRYQIGLEAYYNVGVFDTIQSTDFYPVNQKLKSSSFLFILGHEFLIGHFSLCTQGGIFIYNPYHREIQKIKNVTDALTKMESLFLARIGVNYYFKNAILTSHHQFFAGIFIKTNFGKADFLESTIGYMF